VWRRRTCDACAATVTTLEKIDLGSAIVVIKESRHERFSRDALLVSIVDCCKHRKSPITDATGLTDTILTKLYPLIRDASIQRADIINEATKVLRNFDTAAAVQYAAFHKL
jgi:transcriptional regulator NrdR family protein